MDALVVDRLSDITDGLREWLGLRVNFLRTVAVLVTGCVLPAAANFDLVNTSRVSYIRVGPPLGITLANCR